MSRIAAAHRSAPAEPCVRMRLAGIPPARTTADPDTTKGGRA